MRRIILTILTSGFLLSGTHVALAECQTLAEARTANPNAHLAYRLVTGAHCWFAGSPSRRDQPIAKRKAEQPASVANVDQSDEAPPARAPDAGNQSERETVAPLSGLGENARSMRRIADAFDLVDSGTNSAPARQWRILGLADGNIDVSETREPLRQHAPPVRSAARRPTLMAWLLLTVGIATILIATLNIYRARLSPRLVRHTRSRDRVRRMRLRGYPNAATPLVNHVDTGVFDRDVVSSKGPSPDAPREGASTGIAGFLRRSG